MEKKIKQLLRYLQIEYVAVWVLPLLLVALYETGVMTEGAYAGDVRMDYVLQTVGILLAVGLIPIAPAVQPFLGEECETAFIAGSLEKLSPLE